MKSNLNTQSFMFTFLDIGRRILTRLLLRRTLVPFSFMAALLLLSLGISSCEKNFDISVPANKPQLVVEAYINNLMPEYNYVVLSNSLDYLSANFQSTPVTNAAVFITEGEVVNHQYKWNPATRVQLLEANLPMVPANFRKGVYFDPRLVSDWQKALLGSPGKCYLLEISTEGNQFSSITTLLPPVQVDSLTSGFPYIDEKDGNTRKLRLTDHYKDPDTLNNTQFYYYRSDENRDNFGWGGLVRSRLAGTDDLTNGQNIHLTFTKGFVEGDTVNFYMASVTRDVYNFWDTYIKARDNNGPFATPVTLTSNIRGSNVTGCFSGLSLSARTIIMK